ncbi:hypothetical protein N2152v2_007329 [Parachlorella kessleri]
MAAQALGVGGPALPLKPLTTAAQLATQLGSYTSLHALACAPSLHLSLVQLAATPRLLVPGTLLTQQLHSSLAAVPLVPPAAVSTAVLLHPPPVPASLLRRLQPGQTLSVEGPAQFAAAMLEQGSMAKLVRHAAQVLELVLETNQPPPPTGDHSSALVLVHITGEPPGTETDLQKQPKDGGSKRSSGSGEGLSAKPALLVTAAGLPGRAVLAVYVTGWQGELSGTKAEKLLLEQLVGTISDWLRASVLEAAQATQFGSVSGVPLKQASSNLSGDAAALGSTCMAGAGALLEQFVAVQRALPHARTSPELAQLAGHGLSAVSTAQHGSSGSSSNDTAAAEALTLARAAWAAAWTLQHHPGFGVEPVFPAEHQLAVLLPLLLPLALVLLRAVGGEVKAWRGERRAAAAAGSSKKEA